MMQKRIKIKDLRIVLLWYIHLGISVVMMMIFTNGNIRTLVVINVIWGVLCVYAYFLQTPMDFYIAAGFVGIVMGGIQALSRSTYSKFLPETTDTTSFFSFYDVAEKIGIIIGTFMYGIISQLTGSMRNSTIFLGLFFFGV